MNPVLSAIVLTCLLAPAARAVETRHPFPDPGACLLPSHITLVGCGAPVPDSAFGHFEVALRDRWGGTYPGVMVMVELGANSSLRPAVDQLDPRLGVHCEHHLVHAFTDDRGIASFTILGGGSTGPQTPHVDYATISCEYGGLGSVPVAAFDLNGQNGITLADLSPWSSDFFSGLYASRSDYDGSSKLTLLDLSLWAQAYFLSQTSAPLVLCP